jgi:hypothetical protein
VAAISGGPLAAPTELSLRIAASGPGQARLVVDGQANKRGHQRAAARLLQLVDQLLSQV